MKNDKMERIYDEAGNSINTIVTKSGNNIATTSSTTNKNSSTIVETNTSENNNNKKYNDNDNDKDIESNSYDALQIMQEEEERRQQQRNNKDRELQNMQIRIRERKLKRRKKGKRRMKQMEEEAANRCLCGNGCNPSLPPLPNEVMGNSMMNHHPYGVLPYGNIFVANDNANDDIVRRNGLGQSLCRLNDEQILLILSHLNGCSLSKWVQCSRFNYVIGHSNELWRDLTLRYMDLHRKFFTTFKSNWKDTFVWYFTMDDEEEESKKKTQLTTMTKTTTDSTKNGVNAGASLKYLHHKEHQPIKMKGIYSDALFRSWFCQSFELPSSFFSVDNISREDVSILKQLVNVVDDDDDNDDGGEATPTTTTTTTTSTTSPHKHKQHKKQSLFVSKYEIPNIPCIIENATKSWPAITKWTNNDYLINATNGAIFRATCGAAPLPAVFTMEGYLQYCSYSSSSASSAETGAAGAAAGAGAGAAAVRCEETPLYLFDRSFDLSSPQLLEDYESYLHQCCSFYSPNAQHGHDLFRLLDYVDEEEDDAFLGHDDGKSISTRSDGCGRGGGGRGRGRGRRPDYRWLIIGPKRSGSSFHIDPNCTHAWNAPIRGCKRWIFYPPGVNPPGVIPSNNGDDVTMPISIGEWFLSFWNEHLINRNNPNPKQRPIECLVKPGDILFVPHGWWHTVLNIDDGPSIAITSNYVSSSNLSDVLRFLKTKVGQISGCRDRPNEAIPAEKLHDEFRNILSKFKPDLLCKAENIANRIGWTCRAWTGGDDDDENDNHNDCDSDNNNNEKRKKCCKDEGVKKRTTEISLPCSEVNNRNIFKRAKLPLECDHINNNHPDTSLLHDDKNENNTIKSVEEKELFTFSFL